MSGDHSRFTSRPLRNFSGVLEQQGRVRLDADANEAHDIADRRLRVETVDVIGEAVVPRETIDGFKIANGGGITIGRGRAYVHGLLAECWGDTSNPAALTFDPVTGDVRGTPKLAYANQPFFYAPNFPPVPAGAGLMYLDVWTREVTATEDPSLKDIALGGVDTTTRLQTAWQVKGLALAVPAVCADDPPEWKKLIAPPTGRLTTRAPLGAPTGKPCVIDPVGGYLGLENRLYRVQIHTSGTVGGGGAATFLWSSENAAVTARVLAVTNGTGTACTVQLSRLGRDEVLRFQDGDVIEFLDDDIELAIRETGHGGIIAKVSKPNQDIATIDLDTDLTAVLNLARNPRIRRWDAKPQPAQAAAIELKHGPDPTGIVITFGPAATDTLRAGDYWAFAARTADGSIEELTGAPPRGVLHHYAKLATIKGGLPVDDCRVLWPPDVPKGGPGCCTIVLSPGDDVQAGIDALPPEGGCICLHNGTYDIPRALTLPARSPVVMHAESPRGATLRSSDTTMLVIGDPKEAFRASDVRIADLRFELAGGSAGKLNAVIEVHAADRAEIVNCEIGPVEKSFGPLETTGIFAQGTRQLTISDCTISRTLAGVLLEDDDDAGVLGCELTGPAALGTPGTLSLGILGISCSNCAGPVRLERNAIADYERGINVDARPASVSIEANTVTRQLSPPSSFNPEVDLLERLRAYRYAIASDAASTKIAENYVVLSDIDQGGILVSASGAVVAANTVESVRRGPRAGAFPAGIVALQTGLRFPVARFPVANVSVRGNRCLGTLHAIVAAGAQRELFTGVTIAANEVTSGLRAEPPQTDDPASLAQDIANQVRAGTIAAAITCVNVSGLAVEENDLRGSTTGVFVDDCDRVRCTANRIRDIQLGFVGFSLGEAAFDDNRVDAVTYGFLVLSAGRIGASRNVVTNAALGFVTVMAGDVAVDEYDCTSGGDGLLFIGGTTLHVADSRFDSLDGVAIAAAQVVGTLAIADTTARDCARDTPVRAVAALIAANRHEGTAVVVLNDVSDASVRACDFVQNGAGGSAAVLDICAQVGNTLQIESCRFRRGVPQPVPGSAAVNALALADQTQGSDPRIQFVGNDVEVGDPFPVIILRTPRNDSITGGDVVFCSNVVVGRASRTTDNVSTGVVAITSSSLVLTGNRVAAVASTVPFDANVFLCSATGNVTRGIPNFVLPPVPAPYPTFNAVV